MHQAQAPRPPEISLVSLPATTAQQARLTTWGTEEKQARILLTTHSPPPKELRRPASPRAHLCKLLPDYHIKALQTRSPVSWLCRTPTILCAAPPWQVTSPPALRGAIPCQEFTYGDSFILGTTWGRCPHCPHIAEQEMVAKTFKIPAQVPEQVAGRARIHTHTFCPISQALSHLMGPQHSSEYSTHSLLPREQGPYGRQALWVLWGFGYISSFVSSYLPFHLFQSMAHALPSTSSPGQLPSLPLGSLLPAFMLLECQAHSFGFLLTLGVHVPLPATALAFLRPAPWVPTAQQGHGETFWNLWN